MKALKFSLFEGRHEIPENSGAIYFDFDFSKMEAKSKLAPFSPLTTVEDFLVAEMKKEERKLYVYVTGLTPALTQLIGKTLPLANLNKNVIVLLHFNKEKGVYVEQLISHYSGDWTFDEESMSPCRIEDSNLPCGRFPDEKSVQEPFFE